MKYIFYRLKNLFFILLLLFATQTYAKEYNIDFLTQEENQWLSEHYDSIKLCPDADFEPIEIKLDSGELGGIAGDYIKLIEEMLDIKFKIFWYENWPKNVEEAKKGNVDIWSAVVETDERKKYMLFTKPLIELQPIFIHSNKSNINITLESLGNRKLGLLKGWYHYDIIRKKYKNIKIKTYKSLKDGLIALENGEVDVFISDLIVATYLVQKLNLNNLYIGKELSLKSKGLAISTRKDIPILNSILKKSISRITENNKKNIYNKWVSLNKKDISKIENHNIIWIIVYLIILSFIIILFKKVKLKLKTKIILLALIILSTTLLINLNYFDDYKNEINLTKEELTYLKSLKSPLKVAPDISYAPIEWLDEDGIFRGLAIDYLKLIEKRLNIKFEIIKTSNWNQNIEFAKKRKFDIWSAVGTTSKKRKYMNFTPPYISLDASLIVNNNNNKDLTLSSIKNERVAVVDHYFTHNYIKENYPKINLVTVDNIQTALQLLAFKKVDAVFSDLLTASYFIKKKGITLLKISEISHINHNISFASRNDIPILNSILSKAINSITKKEKKLILENWIDISITNTVNKSYIVKIFIIVLLIVFLIIIWNFFLKHLINLKTKELESTQELLEKSENYMFNIINSMPSTLVAVNEKYKIMKWNMKSIEEASSKNMLNESIYEVFPYLQPYKEKIENVVKNKKIDFVLNKEIIKNGKKYYHDITIYPLLGDKNNGAVIRVDDITEKKELKMELNQSRKLDAIGQLAGGIAHDFNNILTGIINSTQLIKTIDIKNNDLNELTDLIIKSSERAANLTSKLLKFARKDEYKMENLDINIIIGESLQILKQTIDKKISIIFEKNAKNHCVNGNYSELQNIFINMGINSAHAMKGGGIFKISTKNIYLSEEYCQATSFNISYGDYINITIEDFGEGIADENIENIFNPFFTTKKVGEGTGLGLASVYGIVKKHNSEIKVTSILGEGTKFDIFIPALKNNIINVKKVERNIKTKRKGTILLTDDEEIIRITESMILKKMGYKVLLAKNGLEAVNIFKEKHLEIDLVILDVIMPIMNGYEAFKEIKKLDKDSKILIASGYASTTYINELKEAGVLGFLEKPFSIKNLENALIKAFD